MLRCCSGTCVAHSGALCVLPICWQTSIAMSTDAVEGTAERLAANIRSLREGRGLTQDQLAKIAGLPRATWANLESGVANPTLAVLQKVAAAFQVSLEELIAAPKAWAKLYPKDSLSTRTQGDATLRRLLPDRIPGIDLDRIELPARGRMVGVPHTTGTREYLTCERGVIVLAAGGATWRLEAGDVLVFRGDQKHSYTNPESESAVGYSVVLLRPTE